MKQLEILIQLLDCGIQGIERGRVEDLLEAQYAVYGVAQGALPVRSDADERVVRLCDYCLECLSSGQRPDEWVAARVLAEMKRGMEAAMKRGVAAIEMKELVNVSA